MTRRFRLLFCWCSVLLVAVAFCAPPPGLFEDALPQSAYDCTVALRPENGLSANSSARIYLDWTSEETHSRVSITRKSIVIETLSANESTLIATLNSGVTPGKDYTLTLMRRGERLGLALNDTLLFRGIVPRGAGVLGGISLANGWALHDVSIQPLEPVVFADNFMRAGEAGSLWETLSGQWGLQSAWAHEVKTGFLQHFDYASHSQNPFALLGSNADGSALCRTGEPYWEDYTITAAINPAAKGAVGLIVNMPDAQGGLLARWSPGNDASKTGDRLSLYRLNGARRTLLAEQRGGYIPGRWYKMAVSSTLDGVSVLIDGQMRLHVDQATPWRGGVGLYAEGAAGSTFDDVTVYGHALNTNLITEANEARVTERFTDDREMGAWAQAKSDWANSPTMPGYQQYRWPMFGDQWLSLTMLAAGYAAGSQLTLILNSDGANANNGYRLLMKHEGEPAKLSVSLYRNEAVLATASRPPFNPNEEYSLRFCRTGHDIWLEIDEERLLGATDPTPLGGVVAAYALSGSFSTARDLLLLGPQQFNYTFSNAPTDWIGEGNWMSTIRWTCAPQWSFLGGWNRGDAALWHKGYFSGDQLLEAYIGIKMEYPRERAIYEERFYGLGVTICGDGTNPRSGYTAIFGAPDDAGNPNAQTVILRNGVVVASTTRYLMPSKQRAHHAWFQMALQKTGNTIDLWLIPSPNGRLVKALSFTDDAALDGGVPAIWTTDNGISLARARIIASAPPRPREDTQVIIAQPWYPEWANIHETTTLDFSDSWATSGTGLRLEVATRKAPDGETDCVRIEGLRVFFTPTKTGEHWHEVTAIDKDGRRSWPFHLSVPVFSKEGRNDRNTLVLYRFTEGKGTLVRDVSGVSPPADLRMLPGAQPPIWLPGQGLLKLDALPLMTAGAVDKLIAIRNTGACTIEFWTSAYTIDPPPTSRGSVLIWGIDEERKNFALTHNWYTLMLTLRNAEMRAGSFDASGPIIGSDFYGYRPYLQHCAVTWDGKTTRLYIDGTLRAEEDLDWNTESWNAESPLLLGNIRDMARNFQGTYYLLAIHNRALTPADITGHFQAGPAAEHD